MKQKEISSFTKCLLGIKYFTSNPKFTKFAIILIIAILIYVFYATCESRVGIASWYGKISGRITASGQPYDKEAYTAAHKTLAFGTMVKVTNLNNKKFVVVRINDRGPYKCGRIIDLSYAAAKKIGIIKKGISKVKLEIISPWHEPQILR
ncbi:MAG: septal ring lytic transglycosylase RlpA family protein [Candidatus Aceula lacicola]|nr:septal ring lytic transglycosylase RlpA family protein [Candidatus Aceula lacicola]